MLNYREIRISNERILKNTCLLNEKSERYCYTFTFQ